MILIWRGYGFWIALLPILAFALLFVFPFKYFTISGQNVFVSVLVFGYLIITYFGFKLNHNPIQRYKNTKTGEVFEVEEKHDFFFLPMQYWSLLMLLIILLKLT